MISVYRVMRLPIAFGLALSVLLFLGVLMGVAPADAARLNGHDYPTPAQVRSDLRAEFPEDSEAVLDGKVAGRLDAIQNFIEDNLVDFNKKPSASALQLRASYNQTVVALNEKWKGGNKCLVFRWCDSGKYYYTQQDYKYDNAYIIPMAQKYLPEKYKGYRLAAMKKGDGINWRRLSPGIFYLLGGVGLIGLVAFMGISLRRRELDRTNEHGTVMFDTSGQAVRHEMKIGAFRGFARLAVTVAIILIGMGLIHLASG